MSITTTRKTILALTILASLLIWPGVLSARDRRDDTYAKIKILTAVLNEIQNKYVEEKKADDLIYGAIKGMVETLDPHSSFMTPEEMKEFEIETQGNFSGVGIEITIQDGVLTIVSPIEGTPAYQAGILANDQIIKIDGKLTKSMSLTEAIRMIRGPKGTPVVLTINREGANKLMDISIVRDVIPIRSVRFETLEKGYGYIRINNFQRDTAEKLRKALETLQTGSTPLKGLILDLRNNPGGLLDQSVKVADMFLDGGLVVSIKGRSEDMPFNAQAGMVAQTYPLIVLVNEGSASASEIVAGALQDHERAKIVGAKTFGKGSVQTIITLPDRSGLRLTTARYYTPKGRPIQAEGIVPDVVIPSRMVRKGKVIREKDLDKHLKGEHEKAENPAPPPSEEKTSETTSDPVEKKKEKRWDEMNLEEKLAADAQLKKALEMLKNNEVPPYTAKRQN